ncbi:hypothetical protein [Zhaonella formicivorans]|uniref:hypothetical protein n=1 Tax=Zhaonella formicivorans TaxID=2528593 RepID=UPI001D12552B|nr:hypothetical protein [Zhaonella formicivorans]
MRKITPWFTDLYHQSARNMSSNRGSATLILGLLFFFICFSFSLFVVESKFLRLKKDLADDAVVAAGLAALKSALSENIAYGEYELDRQLAEETFIRHLANNLKLDGNLNGLPGSIVAGQLVIESLVVYNPEDIAPGLTCPSGTPVTETTIHVDLNFRVRRPVLTGLFGEYITVRIHRDVGNDYRLEEVEM